VVDNTNATVQDRADLIALGRTFGVAVVGYHLESRLADCLERNRQRSGKASVPDVALFATRKRLCRPSLSEGFDRLFYVRLLGDGRFEILEWNEELRDDETG
jgi:predicted kinase